MKTSVKNEPSEFSLPKAFHHSNIWSVSVCIRNMDRASGEMQTEKQNKESHCSNKRLSASTFSKFTVLANSQSNILIGLGGGPSLLLEMSCTNTDRGSNQNKYSRPVVPNLCFLKPPRLGTTALGYTKQYYSSTSEETIHKKMFNKRTDIHR